MNSFNSSRGMSKMNAIKLIFLLFFVLFVFYLTVYYYDSSDFFVLLKILEEKREFIIINASIPAFLSINFIGLLFLEMLPPFILAFYLYRNESFIGEIKSPQLGKFFLYLWLSTAVASVFFILFLPFGFLFPSGIIADSLGYPIHCSDEPYDLYKSHRKKRTGQGFVIWSDRYAKTPWDCPKYYFISNDPERQKETIQDQDLFYQERNE